jgi:hypothetical protein
VWLATVNSCRWRVRKVVGDEDIRRQRHQEIRASLAALPELFIAV